MDNIKKLLKEHNLLLFNFKRTRWITWTEWDQWRVMTTTNKINWQLYSGDSLEEAIKILEGE